MLWSIKDAPKADLFAEFRASALFTDSRKRYEPGWTTHDRIADPKFVKLSANEADLRLQADSPAVNGGQLVPGEWPDPLRDADKGAPDIGALPLSVDVWGVGVDGRVSLFNGAIVAK